MGSASRIFEDQTTVLGASGATYTLSGNVVDSGQPFRVVGVLEKKKSAGPLDEGDQNSDAFLPYRTARKIAPQTSEWLMLVIKAKSGQVKPALDQVEEVGDRRHVRQECGFDGGAGIEIVGAGHRAVNQVLDQGRDRLAAGIWVLIFPEGTRMAAGETRKYGMSGALLASQAGVKLVPVAHNAGDLWPRRGLLKKPGLVRVVIGPPIEAAGREPRELNAEVQAWIEGTMRELRQATS